MCRFKPPTQLHDGWAAFSLWIEFGQCPYVRMRHSQFKLVSIRVVGLVQMFFTKVERKSISLNIVPPRRRFVHIGGPRAPCHVNLGLGPALIGDTGSSRLQHRHRCGMPALVAGHDEIVSIAAIVLSTRNCKTVSFSR